MTEKELKEEALRNAELMTEEEERSILTTEEVCQSVLAEFNQLCDETDRELGNEN